MKKVDGLNIELRSKRLHLRLFRKEDITAEYVKALNNPEIIGLTESRYRSWSLKEVQEYVEKKGNKKGESLLIGIFVKDSNKHIGNIRLHSFSDYNKRVELGILIWDKKEWGKNYATEATETIINYIFKDLKLHKICAEYYAINKGSEKIFKKLGFTKEGVFKDHYIVDNQYIDAIRVAKFNLKTNANYTK